MREILVVSALKIGLLRSLSLRKKRLNVRKPDGCLAFLQKCAKIELADIFLFELKNKKGK